LETPRGKLETLGTGSRDEIMNTEVIDLGDGSVVKRFIPNPGTTRCKRDTLKECVSDHIESLKKEVNLQKLAHTLSTGTGVNVPQILETSFGTGIPYIKMSKINGEELQSFIKRMIASGKYDDMKTRVESTVMKLCTLFQVFNKSHFSHRDVCDNNVIIDADGGITLIDFGRSIHFPNHPDNNHVVWASFDGVFNPTTDVFRLLSCIMWTIWNHLPEQHRKNEKHYPFWGVFDAWCQQYCKNSFFAQFDSLWDAQERRYKIKSMLDLYKKYNMMQLNPSVFEALRPEKIRV
jgi:serine/threonine protein kinase